MINIARKMGIFDGSESGLRPGFLGLLPVFYTLLKRNNRIRIKDVKGSETSSN